jgi:monoamine oxidase
LLKFGPRSGSVAATHKIYPLIMNNSSFETADQLETIIIVGAGAAGLMAARDLSAAGRRVLVLEAGKVAGGRIRTFNEEGFPFPVEAGAEFVHGELPLTLELLKAAGIRFHAVEGKMMNVRKGKTAGMGENPEEWGFLMKKMKELEEDMPLSLFLLNRLPGPEYAALRDSVRRYAQGFDLADIDTVSTRSLYTEWSAEEGDQYRIGGGYGRLVDWLLSECISHGCEIRFSAPVEKIIWEKGRVVVTVSEGRVFTGGRVILTVPLGMLQPVKMDEAISFSPEIAGHLEAARKMGYGTVIKILLQFSDGWWKKKEKKLGFVISDESIPTWWTQYPDENPLLTGWVPGPVMQGLLEIAGLGVKREEFLLGQSLSSLAHIFEIPEDELRRKLLGFRIIDWSAEPFIRGGYSFETIDSAAARRVLADPIQDTLFFGGEALYEGDWPGTVEAALEDGRRVARLMRIDRARP